MPNRPAPLLTKTLLFLGEGSNAVSRHAADRLGLGQKFRAYDKATGRVIWEMELPSGTTAGPMTYMLKGQAVHRRRHRRQGSPARVCRAGAALSSPGSGPRSSLLHEPVAGMAVVVDAVRLLQSSGCSGASPSGYAGPTPSLVCSSISSRQLLTLMRLCFARSTSSAAGRVSETHRHVHPLDLDLRPDVEQMMAE